MNERPPITDEELHAYIDGELGGVRTADITSLCQYDAALAQKIAGFRADKARLTEVYGPLIDRPIPSAWLHTLEQARAQELRRRSPRLTLAIAASVALLVVAATTFALFKTSDEDTILANVLAARHDSLVMLSVSGVTTTTPDAADRTVRTVFGPSVKVPDLTKMGYSLAAAHVIADNKAVTIDYRNAENRIFTLYLSPSPGHERFDMLKRGTERICIWQDDALSAVMVGEMSAGEMLRLATLAYAGLTSA